MSYKKAEKILPVEILNLIQEYVDGEYLYIPRKETNKKEWGSNTTIRKELHVRNGRIYTDYLRGVTVGALSEKYCLSEKSIQRIVLQEKRKSA